MKTPLLLLCVLSGVGASAQQFMPGNLAVLRIGDGSAALTSASTSGFIDQYTTAGAWVNTLALPDTAGNSPLTWSGSATSEGAFTRSADGSLFTLVGYNTPKGTASVAGTASTSVPRAIATVNADGTFTLVATTTSFSGNNIRSGTTDGAGNYWAAGAGSSSKPGVNYFGPASATASVLNGNFRVLNLFNGNLYYSTGSGTPGIYAFNGAPTASATATLVVGTGASASPFDFALSPDGSVLYVADDTTTGGIQKYTFNGTGFSLSYTLGTGASGIGARGLAVDFSGANPVLFATTAEGTANRLIEISDTGIGSSATTLATAPANEIFRGVDFTVPEPTTGIWVLGALALLISRRK